MLNGNIRRRRVHGFGGSVASSMSAFVAASPSHPDLFRWNPYPGSANTDIVPELGTMRSRTRDIDRNQGVAAGLAQTNVDNIVGTGLRLKSRPNWKALAKVDKRWTEDFAEEWSNDVEARWCGYAESTWFDAARRLNFAGATRQIFRSAWTNGEGLALPVWLPDQNAPASTRFSIIEPDRLMNPMGAPDQEGLVGGQELDAWGAAIAYHIRRYHPGERYTYYGSSLETFRVPAFTEWGRPRILHVFDQQRPGQARGVPALAAVLRQFKVLSDYSNAELKAAVVNAMIALITESSIGQEGLVELLSSNPDALKQYQDGLSQRNRASIDFNGGMVLPLQLGEKAYGFTPARPNDSFEPFVLAVFRQIAAGTNVPYELLMKDFSKTNYSSARSALLEAWRFFKGRRAFLAMFWAQPVFELWLEEQMGTGAVDAPDFYTLRAFYCRTKWIGDGRGWVDPLKEAQAAEVRLRNGLTTYEDECAEQGGDWEENIEVTAKILARAKLASVQFPWMAGATQVVETVTVQEDENGDPIDQTPAPAQPAPKKKAAHAAVAPGVSVVIAEGAVQVHSPVTIAEGAVQLEATIEK